MREFSGSHGSDALYQAAEKLNSLKGTDFRRSIITCNDVCLYPLKNGLRSLFDFFRSLSSRAECVMHYGTQRSKLPLRYRGRLDGDSKVHPGSH